MRRSTLEELAHREGLIAPPLRPGASFTDFMATYRIAKAVLRDRCDLQRLVTEMAEDAARDGAVWVEVHFNTTLYGEGDTTPDCIERFLELARTASKATNVGIGLVLAADRTVDPSLAEERARLAARFAGTDVVAFGLVNDETNQPPEPFEKAFAIARAAGLISAPHAGEQAGPESVRGAMDSLGAKGIGHGVRAVEDPTLLQRLAEEGICCEVCPTSNLTMNLYPSIEKHPIAAMLDAGVPVSLNADNPLFTGSGLLCEYKLIRDALRLSDAQMACIARTSITASGMPNNYKKVALQRVKAWLSPGALPRAG